MKKRTLLARFDWLEKKQTFEELENILLKNVRVGNVPDVVKEGGEKKGKRFYFFGPAVL